MSGEMSKPQRIQSAFISETEVKKVVDYIHKNNQDELGENIDFSQSATRDALFESAIGADAGDDDDLYEEARETVVRAGKASTSYLQRKLGIGYARAARLIDILEERGVVGPGSGSKPREVLGSAGDSYGAEESEGGTAESKDALVDEENNDGRE